MRTFDRIIFALMLGVAPLTWAAPSFAFDGARSEPQSRSLRQPFAQSAPIASVT
jgi:hypothetical protein